MWVGVCAHLLQQDRFQSRIQLLSNILQEARFPKANCVLQTAQEVPVAQLNVLHSVFLLLSSEKEASVDQMQYTIASSQITHL